MASGPPSDDRFPHGAMFVPSTVTVQGKPVVRWGRKARDLPS
jgi:hypothetical protein